MVDKIHIGQLLDLDQFKADNAQYVRIESLLGKDITIHSIMPCISKKYHKDAVRAEISIGDDETMMTMQTTAQLVVKQLVYLHSKYVAANEPLPAIACTVAQDHGRFKLV